MAGKRKKQLWKTGDLFAVPLPDGRFVLGQILDDVDEFLGDRPCAYFDKLVMPGISYSSIQLSESDVIFAISTAMFYVEDGSWPIVGHQGVWLPRDKWPNAKQRVPGASRIGAKHYDAGIAEDLLQAFYGLAPWDQYYEPDYFDKLLFDPSKKPKNLTYSKTRPRGPVIAWRLNPGGDEFQWLEPVDQAGRAELEKLGQGKRASRWVPLSVRSCDPCLPGQLSRRPVRDADTDFARLATGVPVFSAKAWKYLAPLVSGCTQALPLQCDGGEFVAVNVLSVLPEALKSDTPRPPMFKLASGIDEPIYVTDLFTAAVERSAVEHNAIVGVGFIPVGAS